MDKLKICTLSGTEEVGRNCSFIEYKNQILIIDMGFSFPDLESYGIDYLIPNFSYLKKNKKKIVGIVITHGHLDHTGALPYILPELDYPPIYSGRFANALIQDRLKEFKIEKQVKFNSVSKAQSINIGEFKVSFIGVTHSIPDSYSIFVETKTGNLLFSGDYKIDKAPANEPETDYAKFEEIGKKIDIALMESTNSFETGKCKTEEEICVNIEEVIAKCKGRVVVASFSSLVSRIHSIFTIAQKTNRKVVLFGRSMNNVVRIARELRYIEVPDKILVPEKRLENILIINYFCFNW
jgi:ribonuclease J